MSLIMTGVVPHEFYLARLIRGLAGNPQSCVQSEGRFQGHTARTGACFPRQEDDDAFCLATAKRPGMYTSSVMSLIPLIGRPSRC